jgi:hypothetical protein
LFSTVYQPKGIVYDIFSNSLYCVSNDTSIYQISLTTGTSTPIVSILHEPNGITSDGAGNLYCTGMNHGSNVNGFIYKVTLTTTPPTVVQFNTDNIKNPFDLLQEFGNIFCTCYTTGDKQKGLIDKYDLSGNLLGNISDAYLNTPEGLAFDKYGYIYCVSNKHNEILKSSGPLCFNYDTKILCYNTSLQKEEYIPIQNLQKGDLVKTHLHGYKSVDLITYGNFMNNPNIPLSCMYTMKKNNTNELIEDLTVTGGHSILVDNLSEEQNKKQTELFFNVSIDNKKLLLAFISNDFVKHEDRNIYTYYHFTLDANGDENKRYGIWANGILTETPSKKQFLQHKFI